MEDRRPYWKVAVSLLVSLIATILGIVLGVKMLGYFLPFVIGWCIAFIANPLVCWLEKRLKIVKKLGSAIIIVVVLGTIVGALYFGISRLVEEIGSLITNFPQLYREAEQGFEQIGKSSEGIFNMLPEGIQSGWSALMDNLDSTMGSLISSLSKPTMEAAGNFAKRIPSVLVYTIITIIAAYFFIADRDAVIRWAKKITPNPLQERMTLVTDNLKYAIGGYFKAQFKIMIVVSFLLLVGFLIMGVRYAWLLAILTAFLDFLPIFGTGAVLWPWAVYKLLIGNYKEAVILLIIYGVTQFVRQLIQPKLVGDSVGLEPLPTLVFLFVGYKVGSLFGMILAVPVGMIIINMYHAGAFDYILDDMKILVKGIMSLRE